MRRIKHVLSILMVVLMSITFIPLSVNAQADIFLTNLKTDNRQSPLNASCTPIFSWQMESSARDRAQSAYQIRVFSEDGDTLWDSQKRDSYKNRITYGGQELQTQTHYLWSVTVWDHSGQSVSAESDFTTALGADDWKADFIAAGAVDKAQSFDLSTYTLQADVQVVNHAAGLIIGGSDAKNFVSIQFYAKTAGQTSLRILETTAGKAKQVKSFTTTAIVPYENVYQPVNIKCQVRTADNQITLYLNDTLVGSYTCSGISAGGFGFRHWKSTSDDEQAYYDNITLSDAEGNAVWTLDFENDQKYFTGGTLENGRLLVKNVSGNIAFSSENDIRTIYNGSFNRTAYSIEADIQLVKNCAGLIVEIGRAHV